MSPTKTVLITGANRGIGRGLAEAYLQQTDTIVLACVRDPSNSSSRSLADIKPAHGSSVHLIQLDVVKQDHYDALPEALDKLSIDSLDIVIANAGIFDSFTTIAETDPDDLRKHLEINTLGPLRLFKVTNRLLAKNNGKFVAISAASSSITEMEKIPIPAASHGASKAALNYIVRKIHFENPEIISFSMDPGYVQTDLSENGAKILGLEKRGMPVEESAQAMVKIIRDASREETSGSFMQYNGQRWQW